MATIDEQIKSLEDEISKTKYNKATQGHIGKLKAKIAALRQKQEKAQAHSRSSGGNQGFEIKKSGDASVALVGFPSVGKSSLISQLTDVESDTGDFAFTTLTCIPGLMDHRGAKIQILDLPGLIKGASEGKGRGKEILNVIRGSDMVLYVIDPFQKSHFQILDDELWKAGMRLNQRPPQVFDQNQERGDRGSIDTRADEHERGGDPRDNQGIRNCLCHGYLEDRRDGRPHRRHPGWQSNLQQVCRRGQQDRSGKRGGPGEGLRGTP